LITEDGLHEAIMQGREQRGMEFKGPGIRTDKAFQVKIIRAVLGMANNPGGGVVVVGVDDNGIEIIPTGLSTGELATWPYDDFASNVSNYADPYVDFDIGVVKMGGKAFVAIEVKQFDELPVICKKSYQGVLRDGALYVRRKGKNETVEVPSHVEMREIVSRAAEFAARQIVATYVDLQGHLKTNEAAISNSEMSFDQEAKDLL